MSNPPFDKGDNVKIYKILCILFAIAACCFLVGTVNHIASTVLRKYEKPLSRRQKTRSTDGCKVVLQPSVVLWINRMRKTEGRQSQNKQSGY